MDKSRKKDAVREYKEHKAKQGIFAVRCAPSGEVWVASSLNLEKGQNRIWFALRLGNHPNPALQAAWNKHGEAAFTYEVIEHVKDDNELLIGVLLKERDQHWRKTLDAQSVFG